MSGFPGLDDGVAIDTASSERERVFWERSGPIVLERPVAVVVPRGGSDVWTDARYVARGPHRGAASCLALRAEPWFAARENVRRSGDRRTLRWALLPAAGSVRNPP